MIKKWMILLMILVVQTGHAESEGKDFTQYDLCEITGYFSGVNQQLLSDLASYHLRMNDFEFYRGSQCMGLYRQGHEVGEKTASGAGSYTENEGEVISKALRFSGIVYKSLLEITGITVVDQ